MSDMIQTDSGLQYQDVTVGDGDEATSGSTVSVHYTGWLTTGRQFDSSRPRNTPFPVRNVGAGPVIPGWNEGLIGMKVGGTRVLVIPPGLAYGERGYDPVIPPGATLVFKIEVLDVTAGA